MARLTQSKLSHVNESQLRVWNPLFESKDSLRVKQHHIAPNTPRLKHQLLLSSKNVQQRGRVTPQNGAHRRFKKCKEGDQLGVLSITSNQNSVVKPQTLNQRPPHACAAAAAPRRRSALAPAATPIPGESRATDRICGVRRDPRKAQGQGYNMFAREPAHSPTVGR